MPSTELGPNGPTFEKQEDKLGDEYREDRASIVNELAGLKDPTVKDAVMEAYEKDLARLSTRQLDASTSNPEEALRISEGIRELNELMDEHRQERKAKIAELESRLRNANNVLNPLKDLTPGEMEKATSSMTFAEPISPEEMDKALKPIEHEVTEVTDDMIIRDEEAEKGPVERHGKFAKGKLTPEQKAAVRAATARKAKTPGAGLPPELVPGARRASQAEYELTGDEFEIEDEDAPGQAPKVEQGESVWRGDLNAELDTLFAQADERARESSEVLPALSPKAAEALELGDENAVREDVAALEGQIRDMHAKGFSQENLDRLMGQKGVDADKRAASLLYRAKTGVRSLFDPKLRLLLEIYDKKTAELADMKSRLATGKMRLEDPEKYKKFMRESHQKLRNLPRRR